LIKFGFNKGLISIANTSFWKLNDIEIFHHLDEYIYKTDMLIITDGIKTKYVHQLQNLYFTLTGEELTSNKLSPEEEEYTG